jgi:D-glycero-alpha-D-manno-heptose 1-phosphate guanylyltransferase
MTAAILVGGLGTRLRSALGDRPKALARVLGRPFLTYVLDQLAEASIREVVLLTGYRSAEIQQTFGNAYGGMRLIYSAEPEPLGTGGAVRLALPMLASEEILLVNGDSFCEIDLSDLLAFHQQNEPELTLTLAWSEDASRFGQVRESAGRVLGFQEKGTSAVPGWVNAGIYVIQKSLLEDIPLWMPVSLERVMFPRWLGVKRIFGFRSSGRFLDIGTPESYRSAGSFFRTSMSAQGAGQVSA